MLWIFLILALNTAISFWNAKVSGESWAESKAVGGWVRTVVWSSAIQSAIGFSMIYIFGLAGLATVFHLLPAKAISALLSIWYLAVIVPCIGTGLIITIQSWVAAYRERDLLSIGAASFNTLAEAHNIYQASSGVGEAFKGIYDFCSSDDSDGSVTAIVIILAIVALGGGILTTRAIVLKYAGTLSLPQEA